MFLNYILIFFGTFTLLLFMSKLAVKINLVDRPNNRKHHIGAVPLIGGISITLVIISFLLINDDILDNGLVYILSISTLAFIGVADDKFDLSVKVRIGTQVLLSLAMVFFAGIELHYLGDMFGIGDISLGLISPIITVFAVIAAINAFNMVDGIDCLLGMLAIVSFSSLAFLSYSGGQQPLTYFCIVFVVAMIPYLIMNYGLLGSNRKIFMGDAGSMMIGFSVIWLLLSLSQNENDPFVRPVTALWIIAVPLMDMVAVMARRMMKGVSPFKPDRTHLHHLFQRSGFSSKQTLVAISSISLSFALFGVYGELQDIPEYMMFYFFVLLFVIYCSVVLFESRIRIFSPQISEEQDSITISNN